MALLPGPGARAAPPRPGWGLRSPGNGGKEEAERVGRKTAAPSGTEGLGGSKHVLAKKFIGNIHKALEMYTV